MGKTCTCEVGGKLIEGLRVIKENPLTVIVEYKGRHIKRHREKHYVDVDVCESCNSEGDGYEQ